MNAKLHFYTRQVQILLRNIQYNRLVCGDSYNRRIRVNLEQVYQVTNRFLRNLGVEYWLVYGTLLGYYREGQLIAGDVDVDFGAAEKEYAKIWQARHQLPPGFKMYDTSPDHYGPKLYVTHQGWEADIYFYREENGQLHTYLKSKYISDVQPFPTSFVYPLQTATFLDEPASVPNQVEPYLSHMYHYLGQDAVMDKQTGYWYKKEAGGG